MFRIQETIQCRKSYEATAMNKISSALWNFEVTCDVEVRRKLLKNELFSHH